MNILTKRFDHFIILIKKNLPCHTEAYEDWDKVFWLKHLFDKKVGSVSKQFDNENIFVKRKHFLENKVWEKWKFFPNSKFMQIQHKLFFNCVLLSKADCFLFFGGGAEGQKWSNWLFDLLRVGFCVCVFFLYKWKSQNNTCWKCYKISFCLSRSSIWT